MNEINKIKLLMEYNVKKTLSENHSLVFENNDFIFDFVLTEDNKYLIIMDQLFVAGSDGRSIGSIWENTFIFNEIIKNNKSLTESVKGEINTLLEGFVWTKEIIIESLRSPLINEETGFFDSLKSGLSSVAGKIGQANVELFSKMFKDGVLPFLRWVRSSAYTNFGIVVDVVLAILTAKTSAVVWGLIVLLDLYEITTGDFDPKDPDRMDLPYLLLIGDLLAFVFTGAVGAMWKGVTKVIKTKGLKAGAPKMIPYLEKLAEKIPSLKTSLKNISDMLSKKFGSSGIVSSIVRSIDSGLSGLLNFISKLFSREGLKASLTGAGVLGVVKGIEHTMKNTSAGENIGQKMIGFEKSVQDKMGDVSLKVSEKDREAATNKFKELGFI